ncbi:alpha/beta fold hydrolase [Arthrobacter sp. H14-L1]|uniref:alpha/beta fold hydrolase n=1 Tax=Arthrobacter sp. H14-L1 TaxID=2996697 RepID=UPI002270D245|nr:alpha/beta hydrolase [Arthrobacter sp. H14-L1]MCY0905501.1 alpha/beta hydrolase [Arthrobacter sp. H14-L1]
MRKERIVFVHGSDTFGAAAWPRQHGLALDYDALFVKRLGFDATAQPVPSDFLTDRDIVLDALGDGGHVVAHAQGAIAAMLAAVQNPALVRSLVLVEPDSSSLTADLPATAAHRSLLEPLYSRRLEMTDEEFGREFARLAHASQGRPDKDESRLQASRRRLQAPSWEAPLQIVPGVPTLVLTGGWEPLYEEIAEYLAATGAVHRQAPGGHRPQDSDDGDKLIRDFLADHRVV